MYILGKPRFCEFEAPKLTILTKTLPFCNLMALTIGIKLVLTKIRSWLRNSKLILNLILKL